MLDRKHFTNRRQEITATLASQRDNIGRLELELRNTPPGQKHERRVLRSKISSEQNILTWILGAYDEANEALRELDRQEAKTG